MQRVERGIEEYRREQPEIPKTGMFEEFKHLNKVAIYIMIRKDVSNHTT